MAGLGNWTRIIKWSIVAVFAFVGVVLVVVFLLPADREPSDEACLQDLQCWGDRHLASAVQACIEPIEHYTSYKPEWTDKWYERKFTTYRWLDQKKGLITYVGDKLRLQNRSGDWVHYRYECDLSPTTGTVIDARVYPGG